MAADLRRWQSLYSQAARFCQEMLALQPASMLVTGLIEDGGIEAGLPEPVRVFGEMLWNPEPFIAPTVPG